MTLKEWVTKFTACGICLRPLSPPVDHPVVLVLDSGPAVIVCPNCFVSRPPPRLQNARKRVMGVLSKSAHVCAHRRI